jgi:hypothetical protein
MFDRRDALRYSAIMLPPPDTPFSDLGRLAQDRLKAGESVLMIVPGIGARLRAAMEVALGTFTTTLVVSNWSMRVRDAFLEQGGVQGRLCMLVPGNETPDLSQRLIEYETGVYRIAIVSPDQLWHAQLADSIKTRPPALIMVDAGSLAADNAGALLTLFEIRARLRFLLAGCPSLLLSEPLGAARRDMLASRLNLTLLQAGNLLPSVMAIRRVAVEDDRDRMEKLRQLLRLGGRRVAVITPSRGVATTTASALQRHSFDCGLFHQGLSEAERSSVLAAYAGRRLRVLAATEALLAEEQFTYPNLLIFSHLPSSLEALVRFAALVDRTTREYQLVILVAPEDFGELVQRARRRGPLLSHVRETYKYVRSITRNGLALVHAQGRLDKKYPGAAMRAGTFIPSLQILTLRGFLIRLDDLPRAASLMLPSEGGAENAAGIGTLMDRVRKDIAARPGVPASFSPLEVAARLGMQPDSLQRDLLMLQRHHGAVYRPHGRERLFVLRRDGAGNARDVGRAVEWLASLAAADARAVIALIQDRRCREIALGAGLGIPIARVCGKCDRCVPAKAYVTDERTDIELALIALGGVPFSVRRGAVHRIVARALKDAGRQSERLTVLQLTDELLDRGLAATSNGSLGEVLGLSAAGKAAFAALDR